MIELKKKRNNDIVPLFQEYLEESSKPIYHSQYGYGDWYDDEWDNWYSDYYGDCCGYDHFYNGASQKKNTIGNISIIKKDGEKKSHKRGKRGSKRGRCVPLYKNESLCDSDEVTIYFYRDINNPDDKEIFYNLYEFNEFLNSEGIFVNSYETRNLLNRSISHCCVDPSLVEIKGEPWLVSDSSYGGLAWSVCGNDDLPFQESNANDELPY